MTTTHLFLMNLSALASVLICLWLASLVLKNSSIIDIFWGLGFVLVAWSSVILTRHLEPKTLVLAGMVTVWGLRLAGYLAWRNMGKPEDYRYAAMRKHHGSRFAVVSLFTVFGLQGLLTGIISLPIQVGINHPNEWHPLALLGILLWMVGLTFECVGDYQLASFKADPLNKGQVMNRGLWRFTRHPNYFGDFLVWWGFYFMSIESSSWWWTVISPMIMSFLLLKVSGVRLLENSLKSRIEGYEEYVRNTSAFFPLPPRKPA